MKSRPYVALNKRNYEGTSQTARCILHEGGTVLDKNVTLFKQDKLEKCYEILQFRKANNLKYANVCLPEHVDDQGGFHITGYRKLSKPQGKKMEDLKKFPPSKLNASATQPQSKAPCSSVPPSSSQSSTGVFDQKCIFCNKKDRKHKSESNH